MKFKINNPSEILKYLKENGMPFRLRQTMFRKKIICALGELDFTDNSTGIKKSDLGFIGLVRRHVEKLDFIPRIDRSNIGYINMSSKLKPSYWYTRDVWEIDLKGAYWNFAKQEGYLSDDIYARGLDVEKKIRLIALGNLAKRTAELEFDGLKYLPLRWEDSVKTENVFFHVSQLTDHLMKKLLYLTGRAFMFYWVDAIFVHGEAAREHVTDFLDGEGIEYKVVQINKMIRLKNRVQTFSDYHVDMRKNADGTIKNEHGERVFNFRKNDFITLTKKRHGRKK